MPNNGPNVIAGAPAYLLKKEFFDFDFKASCNLSTTAALVASAGTTTTLTIAHAGTGEGQFSNSANSFTLDSVAITSSTVPAPPNTRILIKDQVNVATTGNNSKWNGIYTVGALDGTTLTLTRATDFDQDSEVTSGAFININQGTANSDTHWVLTTDVAITVGTTALTFTKMKAANPDLNSLTTETSIAQADFVAMVDADDDGSGKITFSDFEDEIFGNISGDAGVAAAGALTLTAAQTNITSIYNTGLTIGRDSHNVIDFTTDNTMTFKIDNANEVELTATYFRPKVDNGCALGSSSLSWADLYLDSGGTINFHSSDVVLTHSSNTLAMTGASAGGFTCDGDITAFSSDKRLKKDIVTIESPLDKLHKISGFTYHWDKEKCKKAGFEPKDEEQIGVFAQDVQEVIPQVVKLAPFDRDSNGKSKTEICGTKLESNK